MRLVTKILTLIFTFSVVADTIAIHTNKQNISKHTQQFEEIRAKRLANRAIPFLEEDSECDPTTSIKLSEITKLIFGLLELQFSGNLKIAGEFFDALREFVILIEDGELLNPNADLFISEVVRLFPELTEVLLLTGETTTVNGIQLINIISGQFLLSRFLEELSRILP